MTEGVSEAVALWSGMAALTVVAVIAALWAILRQKSDGRAVDRLTVYRHQLQEIDNERQRGLLDEASAAAARLEIERRILRLEAEASAGEATGKGRMIPAILSLVVIAAGAGLYLFIGKPQLPGAPQQDPGAEVIESDSGEMATMNALVDRLIAYLDANPESLEGWGHLERAATALKRQADYSAALARAVDARPDNVDLRIQYVESLFVLGEGQVTPAARLALDQVVALDPSHPALRYYQGLAAFQSEKPAEAERIWAALLEEAPADAPWRQQLAMRLAEAQTAQGKTPEIAGNDAAAAIAALPPEEQDAMIRGMVANLAARLEETPDDLGGWIRLARAYEVLGDMPEALAALERARALAESAGEAGLLSDINAAIERYRGALGAGQTP